MSNDDFVITNLFCPHDKNRLVKKNDKPNLLHCLFCKRYFRISAKPEKLLSIAPQK
jgi:uncharacterized protein YbaR (Trm112 family)